MLGYFRFSLALLVALNHLWFIAGVGRLAVFSFYVISGYLMTAIITTNYGTTFSGIKRYASNRLLRIYPLYLICFFTFAWLLHGIDRHAIQQFDSNLSTPSTALSWFMNATLFGLDFSVDDRTIPPSWTLFVELFFYSFIPLILKIDKRLVFPWLAISIAYHAYFLITALPFDQFVQWNARYGSIMAGSLGFALGCSTRLYLPQWLKSNTVVTCCAIVLALSYILTAYWALTGLTPTLWKLISTVVFYSSIISAAPVIDYLARIKTQRISDVLGEYSYPFYLVHIPIGFLVYYYLEAQSKTLVTLSLSLFMSILFSWILIKIDKQLAPLRRQNKSTHSKRSARLEPS